jgi:hypothetical protein
VAQQSAKAGGRRRASSDDGSLDAPSTPAIEGTAVEEPPMPEEAAKAVEDFIPSPAELAVVDPQDRHEVMLAMDEHDVRMLLERAQSSALKKWVYVLPDGTKGLTVHAVQDLVQQMNWSGKARIGVLPETAEFERITEDAGYGPEPFWQATIAARDDVTGQVWMGTSSEPVYMRLRQATADQKRKRGMRIPEDNRCLRSVLAVQGASEGAAQCGRLVHPGADRAIDHRDVREGSGAGGADSDGGRAEAGRVSAAAGR